MEDHQLLDVKLKKLIQVCKQTLNYKKLAVVGFILQSNLIDEIGLKLAFRIRNKTSGEKINEYMNAINEFFENNVHIPIFHPELVESMKRIELIFLAKQGEIKFFQIKQLFDIYFTLRAMNIPNLQEEITLKDFSKESQLNYMSFLAKGKQSKKGEEKVKSLLLHKIAQKENSLRNIYEEGFNPKTFTEILKLQAFKNSVERSSKGKIPLKGKLTDNFIYRTSQHNFIKYAIWGVFLVFTMVIGLILYESMAFPYLTVNLSPILLLGFLSCIIIFFTYQNYKKRRS